MYIVITDTDVYIEKKLRTLNRKTNLLFEMKDFKNIGGTYVCKVNNEDIDYLKDLNKISQIPVAQLFHKDPILKYIYMMLGILVIILIRG